MGLSVLPSEILAKRVALLRALLGPGWLGWAWADGPPGDCRAETWAALEQCYGKLVCWLGRGLGHVCGLGSGTAGDGMGGTEWDDETLASWQMPAILMQILREGMIVNSAGIRTWCGVTASDLLAGILPLLAWLYCLHDRRLAESAERRKSSRCLVLLAGIPGSGKSVVAGLVERFGHLLKGFPKIQVAGMDGWHLANRAMAGRQITDERGQIVPLMERKGSPESIDLKALTSDIRTLVKRSSAVRLPAYDREIHEPVGAKLLVDAPIVLLEGNYLLLKAQGWEKAAESACGSVWLDAPVRLAARSMVSRHMLCGRSRAEAQSRWARNDWPNAVVAFGGRPNADAVVYVDGSRRISFVHRP